MAIKCLRCGFVNEDNVRNCVNCGNYLINNNNTSNVPQDNLKLFVQKIYEGKVNLPTRDCPVILKKTEKAISVSLTQGLTAIFYDMKQPTSLIMLCCILKAFHHRTVNAVLLI